MSLVHRYDRRGDCTLCTQLHIYLVRVYCNREGELLALLEVGVSFRTSFLEVHSFRPA
jgi:hypothetical protein